MSIQIDKHVPLDESNDTLNNLIKNIHSETKIAIDKNINILWTEHREIILSKIAELLEESEDKQIICVQDLSKRLNPTYSKKGRPKKKQNPWKYILE